MTVQRCLMWLLQFFKISFFSGWGNNVSGVGHAFAHARYLSNQNRVWLSEDPFALNNFSSDVFLLNPQIQNSYSYATNDPVNKLDPDGKLTIIVPGTWYSSKDWQVGGAASNLYYAAKEQYGETPIFYNDKRLWSGKDNSDARAEAANNLVNFINNYEFKPGEKLNIIMHSHGGNVGKLITKKINVKVDNFVTIETPVRDDYVTNMDNVGNMIETYSEYDGIQSHGGGEHKILGQEFGPAGRCEKKSSCIDLTNYTTPGSIWSGNQGKAAHSEPYMNNNSLQKIFPNYQPNVLRYSTFMGTVKVTK